jgi:uncharacterized protein
MRDRHRYGPGPLAPGVAIHERVWERGDRGDRPLSRRAPPAEPEWRPVASWTLLGVMVGTWILQLLVANSGRGVLYRGQGYHLHDFLFVIATDWLVRPWSLVTSTLAHSPGGIQHLLFNGIMLFFFGPIVERLLGRQRYVGLFLLGGAVAGVLQVTASAALGDPGGALGASGALMMLFGILMVVMPNEKILLWMVVPVPFWLAGILYAALDVLGALNPYSSVGNFAHLGGMALGLGYGIHLKREWKRRGVTLVRG